jgi:DNA-binding MarR family transcriptional regulator
MSRVRSAPTLSGTDYQRLLAFRSELRDFTRWSTQAAEDMGLTPALHQLLLVVRGHGTPEGPTIGEAAEQLHIRHHSAVELAQRAERAGLLTRTRNAADHRRVLLGLTEHGSAQLQELTRQHLPRIRALADVLERVVHPETGQSGPPPAAARGRTG